MEKQLWKEANIFDLIGLTMEKVVKSKDDDGDDVITFFATDGQQFRMLHHQDCCEEVGIEDIDGSLELLSGAPIIMAAQEVNSAGEYGEPSETWTFYKLGTTKGQLTIRWHGSSSGYYSESVDFERLAG